MNQVPLLVDCIIVSNFTDFSGCRSCQVTYSSYILTVSDTQGSEVERLTNQLLSTVCYILPIDVQVLAI